MHIKPKKLLILLILTIFIINSTQCKRKSRIHRKQTEKLDSVDFISEISQSVVKKENTVLNSSIKNNKYFVKAYLENSGSMHGYVKGPTAFKNTLFDYFSSLNMLDNVNNISYYHINKKIIPRHSLDKILNLKNSRGDKSSTDIANLLSSILKRTNDSTVSIFISDCIFSPRRGKSSSDYLYQQKARIKTSFAYKLKEMNDLTVVGYRLESNFTGYLYDAQNKASYVRNFSRPYFVWIIGKLNNVTNLVQNCSFDKKMNENIHNFICTSSNYDIPFAVARNSGSFRSNNNNTISKLEKSRVRGEKKQLAKFNLNIDNSSLLYSDLDLCDLTNYSINSSHYSIHKISLLSNSSKYSHKISIYSSHPAPCQLRISLKSSKPSWLEQYNSIKTDVVKDQKTFGICTLIDGIYEVYRKNGEFIYSLNINIKK